MSSSRRRSANWRNAQRSTGPRSQVGKAVSARNARRHGLTGKPSRADVGFFFRSLMGRSQPGDLAPIPDEKNRTALRLAEAEAQLKRVVEAEQYTTEKLYEVELNRSKHEQMVQNLALVLDFLPDGMDEMTERYCALSLRGYEKERQGWRHDLRVMARYRNEAEARVRKMRKAFLGVLEPEAKIPK